MLVSSAWAECCCVLQKLFMWQRKGCKNSRRWNKSRETALSLSLSTIKTVQHAVHHKRGPSSACQLQAPSIRRYVRYYLSQLLSAYIVPVLISTLSCLHPGYGRVVGFFPQNILICLMTEQNTNISPSEPAPKTNVILWITCSLALYNCLKLILSFGSRTVQAAFQMQLEVIILNVFCTQI